jgi:hypothetical protein
LNVYTALPAWIWFDSLLDRFAPLFWQSAEKEISRTANPHPMQSDKPEERRKWYARGRWAFVLAIIGILILSFVAATRGRYVAWTLWIAVPMLMMSLGYLFLVNAVESIWSIERRNQKERDEVEEHREE